MEEALNSRTSQRVQDLSISVASILMAVRREGDFPDDR